VAGLGVWWSKAPANGNFGDILTPLILNHYGIAYSWVNVHQADAISTGSIIKFAKKGMTVLGSGAMRQNDKLEPRAKYLWVRGPLTRDIVLRDGGDCQELYGDPAMLLPRIFEKTGRPRHKVGYFLHYVDLDMEDRFPFVINPLEPVEKVLADIWQCERIVSSSLHGIIAAHAYGIPAAWVRLSDRLSGDDTKFHDHALSVGLAQMPLSTVDQPEFTSATYDNQLIHSELALFAARRKAAE
jgi:hypothetical protein